MRAWLGLTLALAATPAAAALLPCPGAVIVRPQPAPTQGAVEGYRKAPPVAGCLFGSRLDAGGGVALWRCLVQTAKPSDDDWSHAFLVIRPGAAPQAFEDEIMAGEMTAFHLLKADLDGDGKVENLVALWNAQGNGLGVSRWTLRTFTADWKLIDTRTEVADWGPANLVRAPAARKGCDVAITAFVEENPPAKPGIAFEARFLRLRAGRLVPAADHPPERRRYTYAFQRQRSKWFAAREGGKAGRGFEGDAPGWLAGR